MSSVLASVLVVAGLLVPGGAAAAPDAVSGVASDSVPVPAPFREAVAAGTRTEAGRAGPGYWQQRVEYDIEARLDPGEHLLRGRETIVYHNESPDTLRSFVLHLYQNVYAPGNPRNRAVEPTGGMVVERLEVDGATFDVSHAPGEPVPTTVELSLPRPLEPGGSLRASVAWRFVVPRGFFRMGREGDELFSIAQWYPQVAVYDDVRGWHRDPYLGDGEFYLEYADFEVDVTVPAGWLVGATGELVNPADVLPAGARERLAGLPGSEGIVRIAAAADLDGAGTRTWRFRAEGVRDFAWAASDEYVWDATTAASPDADGDGAGEEVAIHALYRAGLGEEPWGRWADFARHAVETHARSWLPYDYPQMTVAEGVFGGGMEYPMITLIGGGARDARSLYGVTNHEIAHMWFPMMVGSNETAHAWMDEGLASFMEYRAAEDYFPGARDPRDRDRRRYLAVAGTESETPVQRHADLYGPFGNRGTASYSKPAALLVALRDVLGPDVFDEALRAYARRWKGRHPMPMDLFNTFEDVSGRELGWFFGPWFHTTRVLDQGIASVTTEAAGDSVAVDVVVVDRGEIRMPVDLAVTDSAGAVRRVRIGVEAWGATRRIPVTVRLPEAPARAVLDPEHDFPDIRREDNVWVGK